MAAEVIYHPNMKDVPEKPTGLFCFKEQTRVCGADCMAFITPPDHADFKGKQWAQCLLLVNSHRTGKHLTVLAENVSVIRRYVDDLTRLNQPAPPPVR